MSGSIEREPGPAAAVGRTPLGPDESGRASRIGWDRLADDYQAEHGAFLGDAELLWGPEGVREAQVGLLGEVGDRRVLEIGCGAAQGARWAAGQGARSTGIDVSGRQLQHARRLDDALATRLPLAQADGVNLPFAASVFDTAFSANGAVSFVADVEALFREVARVLQPGGRWVFSIPHPIRWGFPDDPDAPGLTATSSYWDRTPYVERDEDGAATYVEHHRTIGDLVATLRRSGFVLEDVVEPEWPAGNEQVWGGWSPLRGRLIPGTAIFVSHLG